ncbi:MAG TPA: radical SAM protein [Bacteroidota bacterium]|nr:radical SAM protein [Bacteroidota bacterium]
MVDVLFTHSYFLKFDSKEYRAMAPYSPLGTLYAATYLKSFGYSVALFDSMLANSEQDILPILKKYQPKYLVIYDDDFNYLTKMCLSRMRHAAFLMSKMAKESGCVVIVHGSDPVDHIDDYLDHGADYVIVGEGEATIKELLDTLRFKTDFEHQTIHGLSYRKNGIKYHTAKRDISRDLDIFPFPDRDLIDMEHYRRIWKKRHGYFSTNIVTTRGCPFHCNWCAKPIYGQVYHSRSPEDVVEEMLILKNKYHPDHLWFCDDIFGLKPGWLAQFADCVIHKNVQIPYKCLSRADLLLKDDSITHLHRSGCASVWIGAESGSQKILDAMEKGITIEQIYESTRLLHERGIRVGFFLQFGYPGETKSDIDLTLTMLKKCMPDEIGISVSYPLPGTKFYKHIEEQLGEKQNWIDSQDLAMMFQGTYHPDFYRVLHKVIHKKFRIWQGNDILKQWMNRERRVDKYTLRRISAMVYHMMTLPQYTTQLNRLEKITQ